jgi:hypothetical protein
MGGFFSFSLLFSTLFFLPLLLFLLLLLLLLHLLILFLHLLPAMHLFTLWAVVEASIALDLWDGKEGTEEGTEEAARILVEKARTLLPKLVKKAKVRARAMGAWGEGGRRVDGKAGSVRKEVDEGLRRIEEMMARWRAQEETFRTGGQEGGEGEVEDKEEEAWEEEREEIKKAWTKKIGNSTTKGNGTG